MRDYGNDVFEDTAKYYVRYQPQYPPKLFNDIIQKFKLNGRGRLLDLGCGTGELAIPLSKYFENVIALDPDDEMLMLGRNKAKKLNINNIEWQKGSSKSLASIKEPFRLVSMGQSFHWMDQEVVLNQIYNLLRNNG